MVVVVRLDCPVVTPDLVVARLLAPKRVAPPGAMLRTCPEVTPSRSRDAVVGARRASVDR